MIAEVRDTSIQIFDSYAAMVSSTHTFTSTENLPIIAACSLLLAAKLHDCVSLLTTVSINGLQLPGDARSH